MIINLHKLYLFKISKSHEVFTKNCTFFLSSHYWLVSFRVCLCCHKTNGTTQIWYVTSFIYCLFFFRNCFFLLFCGAHANILCAISEKRDFFSECDRSVIGKRIWRHKHSSKDDDSSFLGFFHFIVS